MVFSGNKLNPLTRTQIGVQELGFRVLGVKGLGD